MFPARRIPGTLLLALAACLGTVLSATEASACSTNRAEVAAPTCCAKQLPSACGCCGPARSSPRLETALQSDEQAGSRLILPAPEVPDCVCRPAEPTAASTKPQSRPTEQRPTEAVHDTTLPEIARPTVAPVRASLTTGSLPDLPLYLTQCAPSDLIRPIRGHCASSPPGVQRTRFAPGCHSGAPKPIPRNQSLVGG